MQTIVATILALTLLTGAASAASFSPAAATSPSTLDYCPPDHRGW